MTTKRADAIELDNYLLNESEYTAVIIGRDLSSYLIALILKKHGYQVAIASQPKTPIMADLSEYISLKYLYEAARRLHCIHSLHEKGLQVKFDQTTTTNFDWQQLKNQCNHEYLATKQNFEKQIIEKDIPVYEGTIVMIEDNLVRIINEGIQQYEYF